MKQNVSTVPVPGVHYSIQMVNIVTLTGRGDLGMVSTVKLLPRNQR